MLFWSIKKQTWRQERPDVEERLVLYKNYMQSEYGTPKTTKLDAIIASSSAMQLQFLQPLVL